MSFFETLSMAFGALRANLLRSLLTLVGMVIGVFAVIVSVTAVDVIDLYFKDSVRIFGTNTFSVERYEAQFGNRDRETYHPPITYDQVRRLQRMASGDLRVSLTEDFDWIEKAKYADRETEPNIMLYGTDEGFLSNFGFELEQGRPITAQDVQYGRPVALLGAPVAAVLFPNESPLGKQIRIGRVRLQVVGVLEEKATFLGFDPNTRVYAPITYLMSTYGDNGRNIADVSVRAVDATRLASAEAEVISHMRIIRKVEAGKDNNFALQTNDSIRGTLDAFTANLTIGGAAIGMIALFAAGIGIMNIMLVSVTERTKEIGLRKAVGAKRRDVLMQFLVEAIILCQVGGLTGIALGGIVGNVMSVVLEVEPTFPIEWAFAAVIGVTLIAIVFGLYPAYKAARLDPIESLRYE